MDEHGKYPKAAIYDGRVFLRLQMLNHEARDLDLESLNDDKVQGTDNITAPVHLIAFHLAIKTVKFVEGATLN